MIIFEWDKNKENQNIIKHKVSFEEAKSVFYDENARIIPDPEHSKKEERFILLGLSIKLRIIVVVHCFRENEEIIRLISARKATKKEINIYKENLK